MIIVELPMPPTTNELTRNKRWGGGRAKTERYGTWLRAAGWTLKRLKRSGKLSEPIHGPISITIAAGVTFTKKHTHSLTRPDIDNLIKPTLDLLVSHLLIDDDKHVMDVRAYWTTEIPAKRIRVVAQPALSLAIGQAA